MVWYSIVWGPRVCVCRVGGGRGGIVSCVSNGGFLRKWGKLGED